jgi:hypothetical protein
MTAQSPTRVARAASTTAAAAAIAADGASDLTSSGG